MSLRSHFVAFALLVAADPALAEPLSGDRLTFRTDGPQNAYATGAAVTRSGRLTLPLPFEAETPFKLMVGSEETINPDWLLKTAKHKADVAAYESARPTYELIRKERDRINAFLKFTYPALVAGYEVRLKAWQACRLQPFRSCGASPKRPVRPKIPVLPPFPGSPPPPVTVSRTVDTRAGVEGEVYVKGQAELELSASATLGQVMPELTYKTAIDGPSAVAPGEFFALDVTSDLTGGRINGVTPSFQLLLDQIMRIDDGRIQVTECKLGEGCTTSPAFAFEDAGVVVRTPLVKVTPAEAIFFGQTLPERFVRAGAPVLRIEAVVEVDLDADDPQMPFSMSVNGIALPPDATIGLSTDIATIVGQVPFVEVPGNLRGDRDIFGEGRSDYMDFRLDMDAIAGLVGGVAIGNSFFALSADLWDVEAGPKLDVYQSFALEPRISVALEFEPAVEVEGRGLAKRLDATGTMPRIAVSGPTRVTPRYQIAATLTSRMGYQAAGAIRAELIKGSVNMGPIAVALGPVAPFEVEWAPDEGRIPLFDETFPLLGFSTMTGTPFTIGTP